MLIVYHFATHWLGCRQTVRALGFVGVSGLVVDEPGRTRLPGGVETGFEKVAMGFSVAARTGGPIHAFSLAIGSYGAWALPARRAAARCMKAVPADTALFVRSIAPAEVIPRFTGCFARMSPDSTSESKSAVARFRVLAQVPLGWGGCVRSQ